INITKAKKQKSNTLPNRIKKHLKKINIALLRRYPRTLYDTLKRRETNVLAQLRMSLARLNEYLHRIRAIKSN
ncbi:hypothetical protein DL95DRAFT_315787, partial [Leptodontidium sp. 2 PMI_412]